MAIETADSPRYQSIDLLRGGALILMLLVSSRSPLPQLRHGTWFQPTLADLVYPCFLLISGVAMAISAAKARRHGYFRRLLRRLTLLFLIGTALTVLGTGRLGLGTLQSIAIASLLALPVIFANFRIKVCYLALCVGIQLLLFTLLADPGMTWAETGNAAAKVDTALLGKFRGVEGILGSLFSGLFIVLGLLIGEALPHARMRRLRAGFALALSLAAIGAVVGSILPLVSRLISPSFFLFAGSLLTALSVSAIYLLDRRSVIAPLRPFVRVGENPLAIFCGVKLFQELVLRMEFGIPPQQLAELVREFIRGSVSEPLGLAAVPILKVVVAFIIAEYLGKKQLRLRL